MDRSSPFIQAAFDSIKSATNITPIFQGDGGSVPILSDFQRLLSVPILMIGMNTINDNIHAPNERFHLTHFKNGIRSIIYLFNNCSKLID